MPAMIRENSKATKIAYDILGEPFSKGTSKKRGKVKREDKRLVYESTIRQK